MCSEYEMAARATVEGQTDRARYGKRHGSRGPGVEVAGGQGVLRPGSGAVEEPAVDECQGGERGGIAQVLLLPPSGTRRDQPQAAVLTPVVVELHGE
jgi:hypothetical protein